MRRVARTAFAALVFALLFALGLNIHVLLHTRPHVYSTVTVPSRTWAIVPGARVYADGTPSHSLEDRLHTALTLYQQGRVRKILVSGDHGRVDYDEVKVMRDWLVRHGVPAPDIEADHAGFRTLDTMVRADPVFGVKDAVICTQRFHTYRAVFLARSAGIDAVAVPADRRVYRAQAWNQLRESAARAVAVLDVTTGRQAKFPT